MNKKGESKKKWVKWVVGIVGTLAMLFVGFILIFPEFFRDDQWSKVRGMWVFSTKFDSDSSWLRTVGGILHFGHDAVFSSFPFLKEIIIRDNENWDGESFLVTGLKRLEKITIGKDFLESGSLKISHCPSLTSLVIGDSSFRYGLLILTGLFDCFI